MIGSMSTDAFMATHARPLDRRRYDLVTGRGDADGALSARPPTATPTGGTAGPWNPTCARGAASR